MTEASAPAGDGGARRRSGPSASSFARSILGAFARGTGLVAVALVIGIVLLQWSDTSTDAAAGGQPPPPATPVAPPESTTTTTVAAPAGPRPAAQVAVLVLNATGKGNQAKPMADRLAVVGYHTLTPGNASRRPDTAVLCRPGLEREATALVAATGLGSSAKAGALDPATAAGLQDAATADCVVILGSR